MTLVGAQASPGTVRENPMGTAHYMVGRDPTRWRRNIPTYGRVGFRDVYPGVDLVYYGNPHRLEYDFVLAPGADPSAIRLAFSGFPGTSDPLVPRLDPDGDLLLDVPMGQVRLKRPVIYQEIDGGRRPIDGGYVLLTSASTPPGSIEVGVQVATYDSTKPLVIDPVLDYSTYLGGGSDDAAMAMGIDGSGNAYVTGYTNSVDFPAGGGVQGNQGGTDVFVTKLSATGSVILYSTYLGGSADEVGMAIAVDSVGNAYVTGWTASADFPVLNAFQGDSGGTDAFVAKLGPDGSTLLYATYLGGGAADVGLGIAADNGGGAYVTGYTASTDFPRLNSIQGDRTGTDAFVTKLNTNASGAASLVYSTYLGGGGDDEGHGIVTDAVGNAYVAGLTDSTNFPKVTEYQGDRAGRDAFVAKMSPAGSSLLYSTYLGGNGSDAGTGIAIGPTGLVYVTGHTDSTNFPSLNAFQNVLQGGTDAFLAVFDPAIAGIGSLLYSTYLGGGANDVGLGVAVDAQGRAFVAGSSDSTNFPLVNAVQLQGGGRDAFLAALDPSKVGPATLVFASYLGGTGFDEAYAVAVDAGGDVYVAGATQSSDFPTGGGYSATLGGSEDAFVTKLSSLDVSGVDLTVSIEAAPLGAISGGVITVTDSTANVGQNVAGASTTTFYLSADPTLDTGDVVLGSRPVSLLEPEAVSSGSSSLTLPQGLAGGTYYLLAKADSDDAAAEVDEANNVSSPQPLVIGADLLAWLELPSGATAAMPGGTISVIDYTKAENVATPASTTGIYLSTDAVLDASDIRLGSRAVPALAAGATHSGTTVVTIPPGTVGGAYYVVVKADADNLIQELNEGNNFLGPARALTIGTDMIVGIDVPASAGTITGGATVQVTDVTRNNRSVAVPASTTRFYLSSNTVLDAGDVLLASRAIPALGPDTESAGTTPVTIPPGTGGTHYIIAKADADSTVAEINEANNTAVSQPLVIGSDLIVFLDLPAASMAPPVGATISIDDQTKNDSGTPAAASTTTFYLSADTLLDAGDTPLGTRPVPALAPGVTSSGSTSLTLPAGVSGTYYIIAKADNANAVVEANESNNVTATSLPVAIGPDLVITSVNIPALTRAGVSISINQTTKNQGGGAAGPSTTRFYLSADSTVSADDLVLGSRAVSSLGSLKYASATTTVMIPAGTAAGSYQVISVADAANAVGEAVESNNTRARPLAVVPDLTVPTIAAPSKAYPGTTITVTDTTTNGGAVSPPTTTRLYLSGNTILDTGDLVVGSRAVPALVLGQAHSASTQVVLAGDLPGGTYYLIALADPDNMVSEWSETNNTRYKSLTIGPDLTVPALSVPASAARGTIIVVTDTTTNLGSAATSSTTRYFLSTDATLSGGDVLLGSRTVPTLGPGATSVETVALTLPAGGSGSYYVIAQADALNAVPELVESNNTTSRSISITP